jgi:hypothetical protein
MMKAAVNNAGVCLGHPEADIRGLLEQHDAQPPGAERMGD